MRGAWESSEEIFWRRSRSVTEWRVERRQAWSWLPRGWNRSGTVFPGESNGRLYTTSHTVVDTGRFFTLGHFFLQSIAGGLSQGVARAALREARTPVHTRKRIDTSEIQGRRPGDNALLPGGSASTSRVRALAPARLCTGGLDARSSLLRCRLLGSSFDDCSNWRRDGGWREAEAALPERSGGGRGAQLPARARLAAQALAGPPAAPAAAHSRYDNVEKTKQAIESYCTLKTLTPEIFSNRDVLGKDIQDMVDICEIVMLPAATAEGYRVLMFRFTDYSASKYFLVPSLKGFCMSCDFHISENGLLPGVVAVFDMKGLSIFHIFRIHPFSMVKKILHYLQDCLPVRVKSIHLINAIFLAGKLLALIKPFLKKELAEMMAVRRKYGRWEEDDMSRGLAAARNHDMSVNEAARTYSIPRATLQRHLAVRAAG
ncbi:retinaldehyde-binding protein 1-like isoform X3 [Bacillus rossius redtenbacheri]|uniref:retinaldehyde-binding protein 1-like isoform X3 n=1 Tax=Bacillus rossius redtenbacheri TaxID=93214 RepID=UPI002FDC8B79